MAGRARGGDPGRAAGAWRGHGGRAVGRRAAAADLGPDGRRQALRGAPERLDLGARPALHGRARRARAPARLLDSSQYRWSPVERWLPGGHASRDAEEAGAELVRRYLAAFGPAPVGDIRWWTGWTARRRRHALARLPTAEVDLGDGGDRAGARRTTWSRCRARALGRPPAGARPDPDGLVRAGLVPRRARAALFDRSGNVGPTVWATGASSAAGRSAATARSRSGSSRTSAPDRPRARRPPSRLAAWLGDVRVTPRFRTPLERELSA